MSKTRRRRKNRRHSIFRKASAFRQALDTYAGIVFMVILALITIGGGWWQEGLEGAVRAFRLVFFGVFGGWICFNVYVIIADAVEGYFNQRATIHAVIKIFAIVIGLLALGNHVDTNVKIILGGFGFIAFIIIVTHICSLFSKK